MPKDIDKEIREHPEKFDYQDVPGEPSEAYSKQMDARMPQWFKDVLAEVKAEDGIRDAQESRGLGDVYKRQASLLRTSAG